MCRQKLFDPLLLLYHVKHVPFYIIPKEPAVIPTAKKNPNSNRPWAPAGVLINKLLKNDRPDICICYEGYNP